MNPRRYIVYSLNFVQNEFIILKPSFYPGINLSEAQRGPWFILPLVFGRNVVSTLNFVQNRQSEERLNLVQILS